jgi:hypothetical protein
MAFVWCAPAWGKRELARWLIGPYTRATAAAREPIRRRRLADGAELPAPDVVDVIRRAHEQVTAMLRTCSAWREGHGFARHMVDCDLVTAVYDDEWTLGYTPVSRPGMRLADRVTTLFVADFLTRPADYARFRICRGCDGATFDQHNEHAETCGDATPDS